MGTVRHLAPERMNDLTKERNVPRLLHIHGPCHRARRVVVLGVIIVWIDAVRVGGRRDRLIVGLVRFSSENVQTDRKGLTVSVCAKPIQ